MSYTEKDRRVYYQNIVYDVCDLIDIYRRSHGVRKRVVCGTVEEPSVEVQKILADILAATLAGVLPDTVRKHQEQKP